VADLPAPNNRIVFIINPGCKNGKLGRKNQKPQVKIQGKHNN
jgi:hypothetical protein